MDTRDRHAALDFGLLATHIAAAFAMVVALAFLFYLMLAPVKATAFDADGVRCYHRGAFQMECVKVANP